jgi:plastocyanin
MISRHRLSAAAFMLVVSVAVVACGSTAATATPAAPASSAPPSSSPAAETPTPAEATPTPEASPSGSVQDAVTISGFAFSPASITVPVGTKVTWTNQDTATHNIISDDGSTFSSPGVPNGGTFSFTFTAAGTFAYHCGIHPSMKGTVIVTP